MSKQPDMNKIKQNILLIIQELPQAANDIPMLLDRYWHKFEDWQDDKSLYWNLSRSTRSSTIERRHRELRQAGLIVLSKEREEEIMDAFLSEKNMQAVSWMSDDE